MPEASRRATVVSGAVGAVLLVISLVFLGGAEESASSVEPPMHSNPVAKAHGGVGNVTFYYDGTVPLAGTDAATLKAHLGHPAITVAVAGADESAQVEAIHSIGALAYRYVQFYWSPDSAEYDGIDLGAHPDWAYCRTGERGSVGRTTGDGATDWIFLDTNEEAVRHRIKGLLAGYRAAGWDGVMFDRGEAGTQYAYDAKGRPIWFRTSTCTESPHRPGASFADSFVDTLGLAHGVGLQAMMNTGKSPFDIRTPLRPDPGDRSCRTAQWEQCRFLSDAWEHLDLVLNETAGRPRDEQWERTFTGNQRSERHARLHSRTVALVTTASLGGAENQTRRNVYYQWARIKLFNLAVAVNTGDDRCVGAADATVCNRYGVYPELVDTTFGEPLRDAPTSRGCRRHSEVRCVWLRRYADGLDVLNASGGARRTVSVRLGTEGCRYVFDVYKDRPLADNRCVERVEVRLPRWSGRPLRYSTRPW